MRGRFDPFRPLESEHMGRPTKLTSELQAEIVRVLRGGAYVEDACGYVGIHKGTFYDWMERGHAGEELYADFTDAVEKARSEAVIRNVAIVQKAADDSWQAAAWWLERTRPDQYGRRTNIAGANGGAVELKTDDVEREERLRQLVEDALDAKRNG